MGKQNDTDILRAEDVIPPFNQKKEPPQKQSSNTETAAQKTNEIPKFDLGKQIMAQHRKNASTKRKAPKAIDKRPQTTDRRLQISTEYNGVQNVIERAFLSHQKSQSTKPIPIPTTNPTPTPKNIPIPKTIPIPTPTTIPIPNAYKKIISEIVARDIKKLISRI